MIGWGVGMLLAGAIAMAPDVARALLSDVASPCSSDRDCAPFPDNPWCSPDGTCWRCSGDSDCVGQDEVCLDGACVLPCSEDVDCSAAEPMCDRAQGHCIECTSDLGCLDSEFCAQGLCVDDVCTQGETRCRYNPEAVVLCNANGSGWDEAEACAESCLDDDGEAHCASSGSSTGVDATGGTTTGEVTSGGGDTTGETSGSTGSDDTGGTGAPAGGDDGDGRGCGCRVESTSPDLWWLLVLAFGLRPRKRAASRVGTVVGASA
jgi:MYXO-CTERM domain-containing protein